MHTLMIVDDEALSRFSLRTLIARSFDNISVVCEAETGTEAVALYEAHRPDGVIMDIRIPGISGLEASRRILQSFPSARILICSAYDSFSLVSEALDIGVNGYLLKPLRKDELVRKLSAMLSITPSPIEALGEQRILTLMTGGTLDDDLRRELNRYYGSIEHGLLLAFERSSDMDGVKRQTQLLKKHAPGMGYALVGQIGALGAAFLSPVADEEAAVASVQKIFGANGFSHHLVSDGRWAEAWAALEAARSKDEKPMSLEDALKHLCTDDALKALTLDTLAVRMGISPQYLSSIFKEQMGMNFLEYVTGRRMQLAARLMRTGNQPVQEIAHQCGYSDAAYFKKLFKRAHGLSPHEYRLQQRSR